MVLNLSEEPIATSIFVTHELQHWHQNLHHMIKIIIIALFAAALVLFAMRFSPALRSQIQGLLQNPFVRAILFRGLWCLIRLLIFRR